MSKLAITVAACATLTLLRPAGAAPPLLQAQSTPMTGDLRNDYRSIRDYFIRAAEKMPEDKYAFKPVPEVRTFGQMIAHVADDQYNLCAPVIGDVRKGAYQEIEKSLSKKGELVAALRQAFGYCDGAYDALTDATGPEPVKVTYAKSKFEMLNWNLWHTWEHYGNVVVYLRINGLVPPTSEPPKAP